MKVIATALGFDNLALREPGTEFEMPESAFEGGGTPWFEPVEEADKAKIAALRKAGEKPKVPAIDPAKQAAEHEATVKALNEKHAATLKELQDEIDALKKPKTK